ncbi:hypothetical protein T10_3323 [Trichinella papuae]|uniref:Uncharacterized protein n=1 Tax=Trichinella papuae TaxID=268474 RepID=A0A0V1N954_9BILA|nr:hypothetical protein T10_3323 [Trichinella papuae]
MNRIDNKKSENYNELRRTLHESVSVEILASFAVASCWFLLAHAVSSSSRHSQATCYAGALIRCPNGSTTTGVTERHAEQRLIRCRLVGSWGTVARSHPRSWPAASLNWAGWEVLLPRLCVYLSRTGNEERRRTAVVITIESDTNS